jgi:hypothetical protein
MDHQRFNEYIAKCAIAIMDAQKRFDADGSKANADRLEDAIGVYKFVTSTISPTPEQTS